MPSSIEQIVRDLRERRRALAVSDSDFARVAGVSEQELQDYESNAATMPADVLATLLGAIAVCEADKAGMEPATTAGAGLQEAGIAFDRETSGGQRFAEGVRLQRAFALITSEADRLRVIELAEKLASGDR
jgi:transcriptional regulator with XRE-family HTH domain